MSGVRVNEERNIQDKMSIYTKLVNIECRRFPCGSTDAPNLIHKSKKQRGVCL